MIQTTCPKCEEDLEFDRSEAGQTRPCPACKAPVKVPGKMRVTVLPEVPDDDEPPEKVRMECPACGKHFTVRGRMLGEYVECPGCQREIIARQMEKKSKEEKATRKPKRPRLRRAGRDANAQSAIWYYLGSFPVQLTAATLLCILSYGALFVSRNLILVPTVVASVVFAIGLVWLFIAAYQQDTMGGLMLTLLAILAPPIFGYMLYTGVLIVWCGGGLLWILVLAAVVGRLFWWGELDLGELVRPILVAAVGILFAAPGLLVLWWMYREAVQGALAPH